VRALVRRGRLGIAMHGTSLLERLLLAIALACVLTAPAVAQNTSIALPEGHEFTTPDNHPFALSPDGTRVAYIARSTLFVTRVGGAEPAVVPGPLQGRGKTTPVFSPNGEWILYWAQDDSVVQRVPVQGGDPVTVATVDVPDGMSWGADGQILIGQGVDGVLRVSADGGPSETVITLESGEAAHGPQILPGGDAVLFTLGQGTPTDWTRAQVVVQSIGTGVRTLLVAGRDARYLPGGHLVYVVGSTIMAASFDPAVPALTGEPTVVAEGVRTAPGTGATQYALADDGLLAFVSDRTVPMQLGLAGFDGTRTMLGEVPGGTAAPRISTDGQRVTFAAGGDIFVSALSDVAAARRVIADGTFPLFSPDGEWLVFGSLGTAREGGEEVLFLQRADGSGEAELIARPARAPEHWPAGDQGFTFITHRGGANNYDLWAYDPDRKEVEPLVVIDETAQLSSVFSPDRRWLTYMSTESGDWQIYVRPYPGTGETYQVTSDGGRSPMWVADDRLVYDNDGRMFAVTVRPDATPTFGTPEALPLTGYVQPRLRRNWDVMPGGQQFLMLFRAGPRLELRSGWTGDIPR
jgi:Tol biopolymer transport system component